VTRALPRARRHREATTPRTSESDNGYVVTCGRAPQQRRGAHLRHVQPRLRGQLPVRRCRGGGVLRRQHCPGRGTAVGAAERGGRRGDVVSAEEEAAAAGAVLQVQGRGRDPADYAHRRGAQPPAPDERIPRRAPLPHAGGLRPEGTFFINAPGPLSLPRSTKPTPFPVQRAVFLFCLFRLCSYNSISSRVTVRVLSPGDERGVDPALARHLKNQAFMCPPCH
jgi:hypothetical protein